MMRKRNINYGLHLVGALLAAGLIAMAAVPDTASCAEYVVDPSHPKAGDENPGTEAAPWKTIARAAKAAAAGDTVCVMEGDYPERVSIANSGREGKPITFKAVPAHSVVMRGFDTAGKSHLRIEGFKVVSDTPSNRTPGIALGQGGNRIEVVNNVIENMYMGASGGAKHVRLAYNKFYRTQFGLISGKASEGWVIENNEIERQFQHRRGDCDYSRMWGKNHLVRCNRYHGTLRSEIGKAHLDCVQSFNVKKNNPGQYLHHLTFEYNVCSSFSQAFMMSTSTPGTHHHMTFRHNLFYSGGAWGVCLSRLPDMHAINNTFAKIKWYGFGNSGGKDGRADNNVFFQINTPYTKGPGFVGRKNMIFDCKRKPKNAAEGEFFEGDPKFADAQKGNLRLTEGSAAIDAGVDGKDVGALEYPNVYYVDPRHPAAADEGFGYAGWPFRTAAKALSVAQPGETVVLRGGVYRELLKPQRDGITLRAFKGEKVVVSGADLVAGWRRDGDGWSSPLAAKPVKVLKDGKPFSGFTYDVTEKKIFVKGFDPRLRVIETVVRKYAIDLTGRSNVKVEGIEMADTLAEPVTGKGR